MDRVPRSAGRTTTLKLLAAAAVVCFVANFLVAGPFAGSGVFGLAQRATLATLLPWLIATALLIARSERALDPRTGGTD